LRGVDVAPNERTKIRGSTSPASEPIKTWFNETDVQRIKSEGGNIIEIHSLDWNQLMPSRDSINTNYFVTWVDVWADWCESNRIYCILTLRGLNSGDMPSWIWTGAGSAQPTSKAGYDALVRDFSTLSVASQNANRAAFAARWGDIAARYKNNDYIMYGIWNEPFNFVDTTNDFAIRNRLSAGYSAIMSSVIDSIRAKGSNQIVFVDLPFLWGSDYCIL